MTELQLRDQKLDLGEALRGLRLARDLSLADVAQATEISRSFLSLVETGKSDITIGRLTRLLDFYGVTLSDLIPAASPADPEIVRTFERRQLHSEAEGIDFYLLTPDTNRSMMPMIVELQPDAQLAEYGRHRGEEFITVISGELELELQGSQPRRLLAGDSAYYAAERPHLFRNPDPKRSLLLICVNTPPNL